MIFWCDLLWGKYKSIKVNNEVVAKATDSSLWKAIIKLLPKFNENCLWPVSTHICKGGQSTQTVHAAQL